MWICNWLALLYISLFPDIDLKEKISMVENGTKLKGNIFVLTVQQEKKEHVQVGPLLSRLLYTMLPTSEALNYIYYCLKITESWCRPFSSTDLNMWSSKSDNILESYSFNGTLDKKAMDNLIGVYILGDHGSDLGLVRWPVLSQGINSSMIANVLAER